jgi:hypothetical protein
MFDAPFGIAPDPFGSPLADLSEKLGPQRLDCYLSVAISNRDYARNVFRQSRKHGGAVSHESLDPPLFRPVMNNRTGTLDTRSNHETLLRFGRKAMNWWARRSSNCLGAGKLAYIPTQT